MAEERPAPDGRIAAIRHRIEQSDLVALPGGDDYRMLISKGEGRFLLAEVSALTGTVARLQQENTELLARVDTTGSPSSVVPHRNEGDT